MAEAQIKKLIAARHEASESLRQAEQRYRDTINALDQAVMELAFSIISETGSSGITNARLTKVLFEQVGEEMYHKTWASTIPYKLAKVGRIRGELEHRETASGKMMKQRVWYGESS